MRAFVSGEAGVAVVIADGVRQLYFAEAPDQPRELRGELLREIFADAIDLVQIDVASADDAKSHLLTAWHVDRALQLVQFILRPETSSEVREQLIRVVNDLLVDETVYNRVANKLMIVPPPDIFDFIEASTVARRKAALFILQLLLEVADAKPVLLMIESETRLASETPRDAYVARRNLASAGLLRDFIRARDVESLRMKRAEAAEVLEPSEAGVVDAIARVVETRLDAGVRIHEPILRPLPSWTRFEFPALSEEYVDHSVQRAVGVSDLVITGHSGVGKSFFTTWFLNGARTVNEYKNLQPRRSRGLLPILDCGRTNNVWKRKFNECLDLSFYTEYDSCKDWLNRMTARRDISNDEILDAMYVLLDRVDAEVVSQPDLVLSNVLRAPTGQRLALKFLLEPLDPNPLWEEISRSISLKAWHRLHLSGLYALRAGAPDLTVKAFEEGAVHCQFEAHALAVARMQQRDYRPAIATLEPYRDTVADVLRMHAYGALNAIPEARRAFNRTAANPQPAVKVVRDALASKYLLGAADPVSEEWIFEREYEMVSIAA